MPLRQGKLLGIAMRHKLRAPMVEVPQADVTLDEGIVGDARGKPGPRQVTVLAVEAWQQACAELGQPLPWTVRRANLLVEGLELGHTTDATIRIGDCLLQVTGETDPCARMDEAAAGLRQALTPAWRGGVCCRVLRAGHITPADKVVLDLPPHEGQPPH